MCNQPCSELPAATSKSLSSHNRCHDPVHRETPAKSCRVGPIRSHLVDHGMAYRLFMHAGWFGGHTATYRAQRTKKKGGPFLKKNSGKAICVFWCKPPLGGVFTVMGAGTQITAVVLFSLILWRPLRICRQPDFRGGGLQKGMIGSRHGRY